MTSSCILIGPGAGYNLTNERNLFILAANGVEYLRADFNQDPPVLSVKAERLSENTEATLVVNAILEFAEELKESVLNGMFLSSVDVKRKVNE